MSRTAVSGSVGPAAHERREAPRDGARRWPAALPPLTLVVAVAAAHLWLSAHMRAPIVQADEFGYLYGAHFLALGGPRPATAGCRAICSASPYFPGYSLLLVPLWWASHATATVYRAALGVNTALAALTAWLVYVLAGRLAPDSRRWTRCLVGAVVAAYPSYLLFANVVESENLLIPAWLATCILAHRAFRLRAGGGRAVGSWAALGLAGGLLYMVHPSALAATIGVVAVGAWVARPWRTNRRLLGALAAGVVVGLAASHVLSAYVTAGGPSNTGGIISALGHDLTPRGLGHVAVDAAGQILYLLAATAGLVVLAVPLLARATSAMLRRRPTASVAGLSRPRPTAAGVAAAPTASVAGLSRPRPTAAGVAAAPTAAPGQHRLRPGPPALGDAAGPSGEAREAVLGLVTVTSLVMLAVSVASIGTAGAGRLDLTLYGRYNEAVLAPVLVAGALVGVGLGRRPKAPGAPRPGRPLGAWALPGGLVALAIAAGVVAAARGPVLHGTPQATNVLAAHAIFIASVHSSLSIPLLAGLGAVTLFAAFVAWRINLALAVAIIVASFVPSTAAGIADMSTQSRNVVTELAVPKALVALASGPGATGCVGFDTSSAAPGAAFTYFTYRLYDPSQRFVPFDLAAAGRPCSEEVVSARADLGATFPGAREVVAAPEALWVLPGPLAARAGPT